MATLTPSEKHWQVAPTRCLPSPSILTRFATESTAGCQAPRNRQLPFDRLMSPWVSENVHANAEGQPCDVPARAREARDESELNGIANARHDDRDRPGSVLGCHG